MALGNSFSMGQARGKNKPILVKRRKEVVTAKDYTEIQASAVQGSSACSQTTLNVTYYHNGSHVSGLPLTAGDKLYTRKQANSEFYPADGHIKVGPDRGRYSNIQVQDGAVRAPGATTCP
tara:strand:+ start:123 stop:482 length:360 start_codon:yes stop_codon:yes gene_type:complete